VGHNFFGDKPSAREVMAWQGPLLADFVAKLFERFGTQF
jgi:hypothetical protein